MVSLHNEIMNIPCHFKVETHSDNERWYRMGHRDARHAAAELALGLDSVNTELLEALKLARDYVYAELERRQEAYDCYPHKWAQEREDLLAVDAVIAKAAGEQS